jgi:acetyl-CoA carboxylase carboxyltransferase component
MASEMVIDAVVPGSRLREEIATRFERSAHKREPRTVKRRSVSPV